MMKKGVKAQPIEGRLLLQVVDLTALSFASIWWPWDCDSGCRGFESHQPPQLILINQAASNFRLFTL